MTNFIGMKLKGYQGQQIEIVSFFEKFNMYQAKEITKNGNTNTPLLSEADINELIAAQEKINESEKKMNELQQQKEEEERQEVEAESIGNFKINDPKQHGRAKKTLNTTVRYRENGKVRYMTRKEYVLSIINNPAFTPAYEDGKWYFKNKETEIYTTVTKTEIEFFEYLKQDQQTA